MVWKMLFDEYQDAVYFLAIIDIWMELLKHSLSLFMPPIKFLLKVTYGLEKMMEY